MKKIAIFCAACLAVIVVLLAHRAWSDYGRRREAEDALLKFEAGRPPRFEVDASQGDAKYHDPAARLIVSVGTDGGIKLNDEGAGTTDDTGLLRAKLEQIFRERAEGSSRAVIVLAAPEVKYAEVSKVVEAAKTAGATPVSLHPQTSK